MWRLVEWRGDWGRLDSAVARDELRMLLGTFGHRPCGAGPVVWVCGAGVALSSLGGGAQVVSVVGRLERGLIACGDLRGFDFVWLGIRFAWAKRGPVELRVLITTFALDPGGADLWSVCAAERRSSSPGSFWAASGGFGGKGIDRLRRPFHSCCLRQTGGKGIRTPGLLIANETLYQLSYTPGKLGSSKHYRLVWASPATGTQALA